MPSPVTHPLASRIARAWLLVAGVGMTLLLASCATQAPTVGTNQPPSGAAPGGAGAPSAAAMFETPRKPTGPISIQIITNGISPFWDPMAVGMRRAAAKLGCQADWAGPQNSEVGAQKQLVEAALAKGVDGIALSCIEAKASEPIIDMVLQKGVPIITFDSDSPGSRRLVYIGTNNFKAGQEAGKVAVKLLPGGGKFYGFVGNISAQNARERRDGFVDATRDHGIELVGVLDDNKDPARARRNVEDVIARYGTEIQGLLGLFSYNGPAIANAVSAQKGLRERYKIITFDAEPVTQQAIEKGLIDATIVQKPYDFGYLSVQLLYLINRKGLSAAKQEMKIPADGIYDTGVEVVTPANIKAFRQRLAELGVTSS